MYRHVTPFLKSINTSLSSCSLRDGAISFIKYASRILLLRVFTGALASINQLNSCSMFLAKCFARSGFLLISLCYFAISNCFTDIRFSTRTNTLINNIT